MKKYLFLVLSCIPFLAAAQDAYTLKFLPQIQQSQWSNASNQGDAKISVGLPVISDVSFSLYNSGFSFHDVFSKINDSTSRISPGKIIDKLKPKNIIGFGATVSLFSINYATADFSVGFSVSDKAYMQFTYPKELLQLLWYGNGPYIGKHMNIGNFGVNAAWYREYALHFTKNYKKWTFGASPKLLFGKANINTKASSIDLYTAPDYYAITAKANMNIQTSGFADSNDRNNNNVPGTSDYIFNKQNKGLAVDLGAKYQFSDKLQLSAGINNLGYINWKSNVHNYVSGSDDISFDGFRLENIIQHDSANVSTSQYLDSVKNLVALNKNSDAYKSSLPYNAFAMANYKITDVHAVGLQLSMEHYYQKSIYAGTLCYQLTLGKHFTAALSYTAKSSSAFNLGGAVILHLGPAQLYLATDNWWASLQPLDSKNTNLNFGLNLLFGSRVNKNTTPDIKE